MNWTYITLGLTLLAISGVLFGIASAESGNEVQDNRPDHITCEYNESLIDDYRPQLQTSHLDNKPSALYATYCTSPEYETDVVMFFAYYPVQEGFSDADSHQYDREPIYVFVDEDTKETECVRYTAYHYLKGTDCNPSITDSQNPQMYVVKPHHHYTSQSGLGSYMNTSDLSQVHQSWYDNGWKANPEVTGNPWEIRHHDSWWHEDSTLDYKASAWYWELQYKLESLWGDTPDSDL